METYSVKMESSGRILIPAELRKKLNLAPGQEVLLTEDGDTVTLVGSRVAAVRRLQKRFADLAPGRSLADELTTERRKAAEEGE
jgi:AbrB family looped-hinge helix DNA binding protein